MVEFLYCLGLLGRNDHPGRIDQLQERQNKNCHTFPSCSRLPHTMIMEPLDYKTSHRICWMWALTRKCTTRSRVLPCKISQGRHVLRKSDCGRDWQRRPKKIHQLLSCFGNLPWHNSSYYLLLHCRKSDGKVPRQTHNPETNIPCRKERNQCRHKQGMLLDEPVIDLLPGWHRTCPRHKIIVGNLKTGSILDPFPDCNATHTFRPCLEW